ncbi:MAG: hypothetical protein QXY62_03445 [Candidatus Altiarchaeota archaeon]
MKKLKCPKCGSENIVEAGILPLGYGSLDQRYTCRDCHYTGPFVFDEEKTKEKGIIADLKEIKRKLKDK